jgi:hypothetical protein
MKNIEAYENSIVMYKMNSKLKRLKFMKFIIYKMKRKWRML